MAKRSDKKLREDMLAIWRAGVDAVDSTRLVQENVVVEDHQLRVVDQVFSLSEIDRIIVVGAGKAGAGMAEGLERALGKRLLDEKDVRGWINVPEDCVRPLQRIHLHAARPAGVNEPTEEGVKGAQAILDLVAGMGERDLGLCLISGGGSALLPAPVDGITLSDKQAVTRFLSGAGANIQQLNAVRKQLSRIKGGGLARACTHGKLVTLIISDVMGDPLDVIASGPTVPDSSTPEEALEVLRHFGFLESGIAPAVVAYLQQKARQQPNREPTQLRAASTIHFVIGNNAVAVDAAGREAERRGYHHAMVTAKGLEGAAEDVGRHLADMALSMRGGEGPDCLITGGEPVVTLAPPERRGLGGRNQQLVLAALIELLDRAETPSHGRSNPLSGIGLLSGGTDGEDGPTDAAGAWIDGPIYQQWQQNPLNPRDFLARNDAYRFFDSLGALIKTGPTHTNVCDVRVVVVSRAG